MTTEYGCKVVILGVRLSYRYRTSIILDYGFNAIIVKILIFLQYILFYRCIWDYPRIRWCTRLRRQG